MRGYLPSLGITIKRENSLTMFNTVKKDILTGSQKTNNIYFFLCLSDKDNRINGLLKSDTARTVIVDWEIHKKECPIKQA